MKRTLFVGGLLCAGDPEQAATNCGAIVGDTMPLRDRFASDTLPAPAL